MHTKESLSGFIAAPPTLTTTSRGEARFYARIGQEHYRKETDGSFTKLETTFHDLVQFRAAAEESFAAFRKGDWFVAEGSIHHYQDRNGAPREYFRANKVGHDTARTAYSVAREGTAPAMTAERVAAELQAAQQVPDRAARTAAVTHPPTAEPVGL
jgi:single-stranded DNA-binding protein